MTTPQPGGDRGWIVAARVTLLLALSITLLAQLGATIWSLAAHSRFRSRVALGLVTAAWDGSYAANHAFRDAGGARVDSVIPGNAAYLAGLRRGDVITTVNGLPLTSHPEAYFAARLRAQPGDSLSLTWLREGKEHRGVAVFAKPGRRAGTVTYLYGSGFTVSAIVNDLWNQGPLLLLSFVYFLVGAFVGFLRPRDSRAFLFAVVFLGASVFNFTPGSVPLLVVWPRWLQVWLISAMELCYLAFAGFICLFSVFPVRTRFGAVLLRWSWVAFVVFGAMAVRNELQYLGVMFEAMRPAAAIAARLPYLNPWDLVGLAAFGIALLVAQRHATRGRPELRLRAWEVGLVLSIGGMLLMVMMPSDPPPGSSLAAFLAWKVAGWAVPGVMLTAGAVLFGQAVLANRLFGIRFVIRRGLQHLLLSRGVLFAEFAILAIALEETLRRGSTPLSGSVVFAGGVALMGSALVTAGLRRVNLPLMTAIDRRFFVEAYDARRVLLELGQEVVDLHERDRILERAGETILATLHPSRLAFMTERRDGAWNAGWIRGSQVRSLPTPRVAEIATEELEELRGIVAHLETTRTWHEVRRSNAEIDDARDAGRPSPFELIVPLRGGKALLGFMLLGGKLSEEPYSREDKELLQAVATQMGLALKNAELLEVAKRETQQARDIEIARRVQQSLFPQALPAAVGWELAAVCRPARAVGGDYYDLFEAGPGRVALAQGDVTGKGLGASLLTASLHAMVRSQLPQRVEDLARLMAEINEHLVGTTPAEIFATLFVGVLDVRTGELRYVNAGHPAPVVMRAAGGEPELLAEGGTIAGILPGALYAEGRVALSPGDVVLVYSDGLSEATDAEERMYEEERVVASLRAVATLNAGEALVRLLADVDGFVAGAEQSDDISLIVVRRLRLPPDVAEAGLPRDTAEGESAGAAERP